MGRAMVVINSSADRRRAASWAQKAPWGTRIEFKKRWEALPESLAMAG